MDPSPRKEFEEVSSESSSDFLKSADVVDASDDSDFAGYVLSKGLDFSYDFLKAFGFTLRGFPSVLLFFLVVFVLLLVLVLLSTGEASKSNESSSSLVLNNFFIHLIIAMIGAIVKKIDPTKK